MPERAPETSPPAAEAEGVTAAEGAAAAETVGVEAAPTPAAVSRRRRAAWGAYLGAAALSIALAVGALDLWKADLRVPFNYGGDGLAHGLLFKSVVDNGWYFNVPQLGAPGHLQLYDFPYGDTLHLLVIKGLALFSSSWSLLFNVYFLLGFPLITLSALAVFRHFRVTLGPALAGALLFAFLPTRLLKGEGHLFLSQYYQVPLALLVVLWVCGEAPPLTRERGGGRLPGMEFRSARSILALAICVATALGGLYYAFFTAFLLVVGGMWAAAERRTSRNAIAGLTLAGVILMVSAVNALPPLLYILHNGKNPEVATRYASESEIYGLKIIQLLLPITGHRIAALRNFTANYDATAPLVTENRVATLGVMGSVGFLMLLGLVVLRPRARNPRGELLRALGVLNLAAVLLGTIGGFGALFARLVTPQIRVFARINVMIGFLALFALVLLLERIARRWPWLGGALPVLVLGLGLFDQVTPAAVPSYGVIKADFLDQRDFAHAVEAGLPAGAMVYQLPFLGFPEVPAPGRMADYDHLRLSLHTRALRWSYPKMRGRTGDAWEHELATYDPFKLIETLADAGFGGMVIDRFGYADKGAALEEAFGQILYAPAQVDRQQRFAFFNLEPYKARMLGQASPEARERRRQRALHPVLLRWTKGCYPPETGPQGLFRWCEASAQLALQNDTPVTRTVSLGMMLAPARLPARITIESDLLPGGVTLSGGGRLDRTLTVPPGFHPLRVHSDGARADAPTDPRTMFLRVENPRVHEDIAR